MSWCKQSTYFDAAHSLFTREMSSQVDVTSSFTPRPILFFIYRPWWYCGVVTCYIWVETGEYTTHNNLKN